MRLLGVSAAICLLTALCANATAQDLVIEGPDGGDCQTLPAANSPQWEVQYIAASENGTFKVVGTCSVRGHIGIPEGGSLIIRRNATLRTRGQLANSGEIRVVAGDPFGNAGLEIVGSGSLQNSGQLTLVGAAGAQPTLENKSSTGPGILNGKDSLIIISGPSPNLGQAFAGLFNNFGIIVNFGVIVNYAFFHNGDMAVLQNDGEGMFLSLFTAFIENFGTISGNATNFGQCSGNCDGL